ncbi:hypothetical protein ILUMI_03091 [Ignelater luminosus]|uniref:cyclin-dependent kinase n=1 Tax=Ignelater luminosus TaxID=2038154 RepID=A0A8K0GMJ2_IGNLU|nr:hypothetical protein ILUMI_03091 [Ignelater luminosus]
MSFMESGDDQSEDGELRQSPSESRCKMTMLNLSLSEDLDIRPPQARVGQSSSSNRMKRRDAYDSKSRHVRIEKHRDDRSYCRRKKHHREKQRSAKSREAYHREKEYYYKEQMSYKDTYTDSQYYKEHKEGVARSSRHSEYPRKRSREVHDVRETRRYMEDKSAGAKALDDLREHLLSRSSTEGDEDLYRFEKSEGHKEHYKKQEQNREDKLIGEERAEQELRRERLLRAEMEMTRQKEKSGIERDRRYLEKQAKRKHEEEVGFNKRVHSDEINIVTVSDNSDSETESSCVDDEDDKSNHSVREGSGESTRSDSHSHNRSRSSSREVTLASSEKLVSCSVSREGSCSQSTKSDTNIVANDSEKSEDHKSEEVNKVEIDETLPPYYPAIQGCRSVEEFQPLNRIEEGTYGVVYRARDKRTGETVALKRLKMEREKEGFPITSLREINTLLKGQHPNIVTVREIVFGSNIDRIFIVMDFVEHDLKSLMETMKHKKQTFTVGEVKCLLKQLLCAVAHLHDNWILHRDLKTSNLLLSHKGILKVVDFGLAREYGSPLKAYTPIVVTLWYRAPELLLCTKEYSTPIDVWSIGCIFGELLLMNPVFPGKSEVEQINKIFKDLGTPNEKIWTGFNNLPAVQKMKFTNYPTSNLRSRFRMLTDLGQELLQKFLTYDPVQRITAEDALQHPYFDEIPLPIDPSMFPVRPAKSELGHKKALAASPKSHKQSGGHGDEDSLGFHVGVAGTDNRRLPVGAGFTLKF